MFRIQLRVELFGTKIEGVGSEFARKRGDGIVVSGCKLSVSQ